MLYTILGIVAALLALLVIFIAFRPSEYTVTRTGKMQAPPAQVFEQVNDFRKWTAWSPWENIDPNLQRTHSGAAQGVGAKYHWVGDKNVGEGEMTITESRPSDLIRIKLEFIKPFASICDTLFTFQPEGDQTVMTWKMEGKHSFMPKAMCLFMNMDKMLGDQFEKGLANMKGLVEGKAA